MDINTTIDDSAIVLVSEGSTEGVFIPRTIERLAEWFGPWERWLLSEIRGWVTIEGVNYALCYRKKSNGK